MKNVNQTIISQYANRPRIVALIEKMNEYFDQSGLFEAFYDNVWNVETASGFGLDIWGKIVGVGRMLQIPAGNFFGFSESGDWSPFDDEPFYNGISGSGGYNLSDEAYRKLIMLKAMANIAATTVPKINAMLQFIFGGRGRCYINTYGRMRIRYTFEFALHAYERAAMLHSGVFPAPMGVTVYLLEDAGYFGFSEAGDTATFSDGPMLDDSLITTIS